MLKDYFPHEYARSVFVIDYQKLYQKGYRGIVFDIDMTLVPHGAAATPEVEGLFQNLQAMGLKTLLLSNNNEQRIQSFIKNMDTPYIAEAGKPNTAGYGKALEMLGLKKEEVVYIGDQLFIDIYGANKSQIPSILVRYVCKEGESRFSRRRMLEKCLLALYKCSRVYCHRLGDILL